MWTLYEALIEGIPSHTRAEMVCRGRWQAYVETEAGCGVTSLLLPWKKPFDTAELPEAWQGRPLRDVAALCRSWDGVDSALGMAAINAWYNSRARLEEQGTRLYDPASPRGDVFQELRDFCRDKTVSIVGHFPGASALEGCREIRVFEREPKEGDYPDAAEEYLIPGSDVVIITGMAFTNKTLPRLLELGRDSFLALTGPSVTLSEALFGFGVDAMYGMTVWDAAGCRNAILRGDRRSFWDHVGKAIMIK